MRLFLILLLFFADGFSSVTIPAKTFSVKQGKALPPIFEGILTFSFSLLDSSPLGNGREKPSKNGPTESLRLTVSTGSNYHSLLR